MCRCVCVVQILFVRDLYFDKRILCIWRHILIQSQLFMSGKFINEVLTLNDDNLP